MPDVHLRFGGSTATRTLNCPNWQNICDDVPKVDREGAAAKRGTMLHDIMEAYYDRDEDLSELCRHLEPADREAIDYAVNMTEAVMDQYNLDDFVCEAFVTLAEREDTGGSGDMILCNDDTVVVLDYKFGYQPIKNRDQMLFYAMCAMDTPEVDDMFFKPNDEGKQLVSVVIQPAVSETALIQEHTWDEYDAFYTAFLESLSAADKGEKVGNPGEWCKYCPATSYCPAKRERGQAFLAMDPSNLETLSEAMQLASEMETHIKDVKAELFRILDTGQKVDGWKLVLKRATSRWADEEKVRHMLRYNKSAKKEMYITESLRSPAQVKKQLKDAGLDVSILDDHITTASSGTTIAPASDKRPAVEKGNVPDAINDIMNK
jgi:RecB family exonuclease